jgi:hypothetical protein
VQRAPCGGVELIIGPQREELVDEGAAVLPPPSAVRSSRAVSHGCALLALGLARARPRIACRYGSRRETAGATQIPAYSREQGNLQSHFAPHLFLSKGGDRLARTGMGHGDIGALEDIDAAFRANVTPLRRLRDASRDANGA